MERTRHTALFLALSVIGMTVYISATTDHRRRVQRQPDRPAPEYAATVLAFGDVNLGRGLGQIVLHEGPGYVFRRLAIGGADIVMVNLESTLSDQHGETESPSSNYIFTGPPSGALALAQAGITLAATANNHAYDYGERALVETIDCLDRANIGHVGTARDAALVHEPLCIERNGIRFAVFAVTDIMNLGRGWRSHAACTDTSLLFPKLREASRTCDAVIVSVHGGDEYADSPSPRLTDFMRGCIAQGARLVLGHHPHVPYGIDSAGGGYIVHSLGNFVFHQPQREWTQMSYGVVFAFARKGGAVSVALKGIIPIDVGFQPARMDDSGKRVLLMARAQRYSTVSLKQFH